MKAIVRVAVTAAASCLAACAGSRGLDKAFTDSKSAVQGNSHTFRASPEMTLRVVTGTLVQKGFAIEQVDSEMGLIKASRNLTDTKSPDTNYHISATAYVSATSGGAASVVSLAASQQTVLYRKGHTWTMLPLIPIIPIPTGKKYETVVTGEGSILDGGFYGDFFAAVERGLEDASAVNTTRLAAGTASPAQALPVAAEPAAGTPAATQGSPAAADGAPH
jgi:hypothetical protein